jgi:hypothetical protein
MYYEVRPDVFDSLTVWAQQRDLVLKRVGLLVELAHIDSALQIGNDSTIAQLNYQLRLMADREAIYKDAYNLQKKSGLRQFWDDAKFPLGIAVGAFVTSQIVRIR